jgi:hypothetical protein
MDKDRFFMLINLCSILLFAAVCVSVWLAPVFSLSLLGICGVAVLFFLTEKWITHDATEFENRLHKLLDLRF